MVLEMKIPSPGESITEVEISQWLVKDGDIVTKDQTIAEIDSDKATLDLPAEESGKITLKAEEGDLMAVGDIVCLIDTSVASDSKPLIKEPVVKEVKEEKKVDLILRNSENLSFAAVEQEIKRLADHVRNKTITVDDLTGGTFTISNGGVFGSMLSTPIINPPQSGILGMHNIIQRPVAVDGKVEIRPMMYLALSYDHRIIDGNQSVGFLIAVKEGVEDPENILMDGKVEKHLGLS